MARVLQLIGNLEIGGAQEVVRTLAAYLPGQGDDVIVASLRDGPLRAEMEKQGTRLVLLRGRGHSILALPWFLWDMLRLYRELQQLVERSQIQVVQTHLLRTLDFLVLLLKIRRPGLQVFWTVHNINYALRPEELPRFRWLLGAKRRAHRWLYRRLLAWVDGMIAVSNDVERALRREFPEAGEKIITIANGVDTVRYQVHLERDRVRQALAIPAAAPVAIVVGTLKEQKGHTVLIEALPEILEKCPTLQVIFAGDGGLRASLEEQSRALEVRAHIHFLGARDDVPALLKISDVFILPSLWEGLPMALIEAMAAGLPAVATDVSGVRDVMLDGITGKLAAPGDAGSLALAVSGLLQDRERARQMGLAAAQRVEECFSAGRQAADHHRLYMGVQGKA